MRIYDELDKLGFFEWYCTQYGGLVYIKYESVYDLLPLDNLITTELNACAFKFLREKYKYSSYVKEATKDKYRFYIEKFDEKFYNSEIYNLHEEAESQCLKKLIEIIKK